MWDATCTDILAPSHSTLAVREARTVAADDEYKKIKKYSHLLTSHCFISVAVERLGVFGKEVRHFFREVTQQIKSATEELLAHQYLVQRILVAVRGEIRQQSLDALGWPVTARLSIILSLNNNNYYN